MKIKHRFAIALLFWAVYIMLMLEPVPWEVAGVVLYAISYIFIKIAPMLLFVIANIILASED